MILPLTPVRPSITLGFTFFQLLRELTKHQVDVAMVNNVALEMQMVADKVVNNAADIVADKVASITK